MAKPTAAQVKEQLLKTQAANQAQGNQPTAETLNKRATRQAERGELTVSQQQSQSKAFATRTAQEEAQRQQQAAQQTAQPMTGTDYRNALMGLSSRSANRNNSDMVQDAYSDLRSRSINRDNTDIIQGITQDWYRSMSGRGTNRNISIENPQSTVIKARTSAGSITRADPFAKENPNAEIFSQYQQTETSPVFLNPERTNPQANLTGQIPQQDPNVSFWDKRQESKAPFGAVGVDENGLPYYGTGVKGWIRKTWADLADPAKYKYDLYELTPDEQERVTADYEKHIQDSAAILNERLNWDNWGKNLFGLSAEEVATFTSARGLETDIAKQTGQSVAGVTASRLMRIGIDTTQNFIWGGLDILGMDDTVVRKMISFTSALDSTADKFKKDEEGFWTKLSASPTARFLLPPLQVVHGLNMAQDWITVAKNDAAGEMNLLDKESTATKYLAGSAMAYSMIYDQMALSQFQKGLAEGRDPGELAQSYGNTGIELAGSILGSPSTYFGLTVKAPAIFTKAGRAEGLIKSLTTWKTVVSVPSFGEVIGLGVGKARLAAQATRFDGVAKEFSPIVEILQDAQKLPDAEIASKLDEVVQATATTFDNQRKFRGNIFTTFASYDSAGKISVASRDANLFIGALTGTEGASNTLDILSDMVKARRGGDEAVRAAERLLSRTDSGVFSEVGNMVGEVLSRLDDVDMLAITKKYAGSPETSKLHAEVMGKINDVLEEFIPSVDDMLAAKKALAAGDNSPRVVQLAKMADDLPTPIKVIRGLTKVPQKIAQATSGYMIQSFMALMNRSTAKNVWGQIVPIAFMTGITDAIKITANSILGGINQNVLSRIADSKVVAAADSVIGKSVEAFKATAGAVGVSQDVLAKIGKADNVIGKAAESLSFESRVAKQVEKINELVGFLPANEAGLEKMVSKKSDFLGGLLKKVTGGFLEGQLPKMGRMEELASLGIIESTLKSELQKALPAVIKGLPEYEAFMKTLPTEQRGLFTHLLETNYGNWDNAVADLRKLAGKGNIDAWRVTPISPQLSKELDRMGLLETFYDVQRNVDDPDKFKSFLDDFDTQYRARITEEAKKLPSTMQKPPEGEEDFFEMLEMRPGRQNDFIRELYQSAQNMRDKLDEVTLTAKTNLRSKVDNLLEQAKTNPDMLAEAQKANSALMRVETKLDAIAKETHSPQERLNLILEQTKSWYYDSYVKNGHTFSPQEMDTIWNKKIVLGKTKPYKLADMFPQVDPATLTPDALVDLMWNAQRNDRADKWWFYNNKKYANTMQALSELAEDLGTTLDEVATLDKSGTNPYRELTKLQAKYQTAEEMFSWQRYLDQFTATPDVPLSRLTADAKGRQLNQEYITRIVNEAAQQAGEVAAIPFEQVTLKQAREALQQMKFIPSYDGGQINETRVTYEGMDNFLNEVRLWGDKVAGEWGKTVKTTMLENEDAMNAAKKAFDDRMKVVRRKAAVVSVSTRNFALHDYNKTYFDHAATMLLGNSLHYWTSRSYMRSIETMIDNPKVANIYMAYKEYMTKEHSDMPEWYRYNIDVGALLGIDTNNQYFINLESAINPMNGLTGVDFDDPYKRVDWMSRMMADVGKLGVGVSPFYQWALALKLHEQGKAEAAERWAGRLLPFSQTVKSVTSGIDNVLNKFGVNANTQAIEIDPFVLAFGEGKTIADRMLNSVDPYERNKVVAALAMMVDEGTIINGVKVTEEQMIEAARAGSGDIWQAAIERASDARAGGDVQAFFAGSAMKPRTADDMKIEKFWQDYGMLQSARSQMTPDEYRQAFTQMHDNPEYGSFVDGLLLSRKSGDAMETAYTYNVLGRIPPGQMNDIAAIVGIDPEHIALFYEMKGDFSKMGLSESDLAEFQAGIYDMAATYQIPSTATRQEWNYATSLYGQMRDTLSQEFGADIHDKIAGYYDLKSTADKKKYIEANPEVRAAMDRQTEFITNTPTLMEYYGSMNTLEMNYSNQTRTQLEKKYSSSVINDASMLYDKNTSAEQRDAIFREYSPLRQYQYEYGNAKETAAQQLASKYANIQEGYDLLNSPESILPDGKTNYAYVNKIKSQYKIKQYESELRTLTKKIEAEINASVDPQIIVDARLYNKVDEDAKLAIEAKYSELEAYLNERSELYDQNLQDIIDYGGYLPDAPTAEVRPDANPNGDAQQQDLYDLAMNPVPEKTFEDWTVEIGTPAAELIQYAYDNGENVDYEALKQLRREADRLGYNDEYDLLQAILISLSK